MKHPCLSISTGFGQDVYYQILFQILVFSNKINIEKRKYQWHTSYIKATETKTWESKWSTINTKECHCYGFNALMKFSADSESEDDKRRRSRTNFSQWQLEELERVFQVFQHLSYYQLVLVQRLMRFILLHLKSCILML